MSKRLTDYADCAGCASKLDAALLVQLTEGLAHAEDPRVLVDFRTADDAGVYRWDGGPALVQTVDFFTPIVDDPYDFGQIAAANALSDVYAMGGLPRTALAITALPKDGPPASVIREIFRGGGDALRQAGVALLGGHTVTDPEIKFGYSVTGEVDPDRILTNAGARVGDVLVLTKPLGTGIIVRARKYGQWRDDDFAAAVAAMKQLNDVPAHCLRDLPAGTVSACTDVTGFGLAGHATEMAQASGVSLRIQAGAVPSLPGALELAREFLPCGGRANLKFFQGFAAGPDVPVERHLLCLDPQTSGGLLIAVHQDRASGLLDSLAGSGRTATVIGRVEAAGGNGAPLVRLD
jgi:selenide,water dikinase